MKNKLMFIIFALLFVLSSSRAYGWGTTGGDGSQALALQETAVFYNNLGESTAAGDVFVFDTSATAGTTLGAYVVKRAVADEIMVAGVAKATAAANSPVILVTRGPVQALALDSSDAVGIGSGVGTTITTGGRIGGGQNVGFALEAGGGTDGELIWIWVDPDNSARVPGFRP